MEPTRHETSRTAAWRRRDVLAAGAGAAGVLALPHDRAQAAFDDGDVRHLLVTANEREIQVKASLKTPVPEGVRLTAGDRSVAGIRSDSEGRFWRFRLQDLRPATQYALQIQGPRRAFCAPWPVKTFPAPDALPSSFRLLTFTCAGGIEGSALPGGIELFRSLAFRRRLLARALSFGPDAVIANGDHIYWDQQTFLDHPVGAIRALARRSFEPYGFFEPDEPMIGTGNESVLTRVADPQIAALYGTMLRSVPAFFVSDDHDYFENDVASARIVSFPPDHFQVRAQRATAALYYPAFLPDAARPLGLAGTRLSDGGLSDAYGTLRYGKLFEALIYDCGRFLSLKGPHAGLISPDAERWLMARTAANDTAHLVHVPSHPMGWTAGKWREWYPDLPEAGELYAPEPGQETAKYFWQDGWWRQHQRLLTALTANRARPAVMVSGDLHASGWDRIVASGNLDLGDHPVTTVLAGPLGSSTGGWPSFARGRAPGAPRDLTLARGAAPQEKNGFTLIDVEPERMVIRLFAWREPDPVEAIDTLEPYDVIELRRPS